MSFSFVTSATKTTAGFTATVSTATTSGFSLVQPTATTGSAGFTIPSTGAGLQSGFGLSTTGFPLLTSTTTPAITTSATLAPATTSAAQIALATSTVVTNSSTAQNPSLNFCQLEENINKWTLELEEQEKVFMNQVSQVNSWDRMLISNAEKIVNLNAAVEQVKLQQQQLEHELDFIVAQQRELEECLVPLETELENTTTTGIDPEREQTYDLAENLDSQLKQMSEDLKELIDLLNEMNRSGKDSNDPFVQIGRILNAHMNSLQWIDQNTTQLATQIEQVSKLHDVLRRENERSFHLTYDKEY